LDNILNGTYNIIIKDVIVIITIIIVIIIIVVITIKKSRSANKNSRWGKNMRVIKEKRRGSKPRGQVGGKNI